MPGASRIDMAGGLILDEAVRSIPQKAVRTRGRGGIDRIARLGGRWCLIAGTALTVANCAGNPGGAGGQHASELKYGVKSSPRVIPEGEPIPKGGGREMVGQPYVVAGRTYMPHPGRGYDREGWASWYGTAFHGRLTANGEIFDRQSIAAAHPTLPLPSYVRVTNVVNHRSMIVRVNDRGPYERSRLIDLSERAAEALDFRHKGTGRVRVEYVGKASLDGSDDEKLMATLRTDGGPASLSTGGRSVMLAGLAQERLPLSGPSSTRADPVRSGRSVLPEHSEPVRRVSRDERRTRTAAGEDETRPSASPERRPIDIRPPHRPDIAGIY